MSKWEKSTTDNLKSFLHGAIGINKNFTVKELQLILSKSKVECKHNQRKPALVNLVSTCYGDGSSLALISHIPSLRQMALYKLQKLPKMCTNILYAVNIWSGERTAYENRALFKSDQPWTIETEKAVYQISHWYAQPVKIHDRSVQPIIDAHHIFVNNRVRCCTVGMPEMGIFPKAWIKVAEQENSKDVKDRTGLSLELVVELRDKQRNAFAATTFSEKVQEALIQNGDANEANWCKLIRQWYASIDEAGVPLGQRIQWMLDMRSFLLQFYTPGTFPPPGLHMAGLPITQYEGILSNIDRRLQLYAMAGSYNQRYVSSLDSETMFGSFQVCPCL